MPAENYLHDLGKEILSLANRTDDKSGGDIDRFEAGRRFAFYEVLSLLKQQAIAFGISETEIGLEGADIEKLIK